MCYHICSHWHRETHASASTAGDPHDVQELRHLASPWQLPSQEGQPRRQEAGRTPGCREAGDADARRPYRRHWKAGRFGGISERPVISPTPQQQRYAVAGPCFHTVKRPALRAGRSLWSEHLDRCSSRAHPHTESAQEPQSI
jgi:hypothetical protein